MKKVNQILVVAVLLLGSVSSYAQRPNGNQKPNPEMVFKMLDTNKDKKISKVEAEKARGGKLAENFKLFDANNDGFIVLEELQTIMSKRKPEGSNKSGKLKLADTNKDGKISIEEASSVAQKRVEQRLKLADTNNNGFLDANELKRLKEQRAKHSKS